MRILIGGTPSKIFHVKEFSEELIKLGLDCKVVKDVFLPPLGEHLANWFQSEKNFDNAIQDFKPDLVLAIQPSKFGLSALKAKVPFLIQLHGNYWTEAKLRKKVNRGLLKNQNLWLMERIEQKCLKESDSIIPVSKYLENEIKNHYPGKKTHVMYQGINPNNWYEESGINLKHPCVGLLQTANIWGKAKAMLLLPKILEAMPDVMFYWVGDGPYRDKILPALTKYDNFKWMGKLEYPKKVRQFLTEIDVYALLSGLDTFGRTTIEAELMKKPVVATKVGGIPETIIDKKTGYLIEEGNHLEWVERLTELVNDEKKRKKMGLAGQNFVIENFGFDRCAREFLSICKQYV